MWNFEDNLSAKGIVLRFTSKPERGLWNRAKINQWIIIINKHVFWYSSDKRVDFKDAPDRIVFSWGDGIFSLSLNISSAVFK